MSITRGVGYARSIAGYGGKGCKDTVKIEKEKSELVDNKERRTKIFNHSKLAIIAIYNLSIA